MTKKWDVLGIGCTAVDDLLFVENFPKPDVKIRVQHAERQAGGLTGVALVAAARIGATCAYGGQLGFDEYSLFMANCLESEGVSLAPTTRHEKAAPFHSTIVVDTTRNTRNIFFQQMGEVGPAPGTPSREELAHSCVLLIDHYGGENNTAAIQSARELGVPIVADIERDNVPEFHSFFPLVDHLILSRGFATKITGKKEPEAIVRALWNEYRSVVIVTGGELGCWSLEDGELQHWPAVPVEVVDTTGCGDVFHGVYAATLAWGWPLEKRIRYASVAAALKAEHRGAVNGIPRRDKIEKFQVS